MSLDQDQRDEPAPLNILEYTFSEKMLFVDTSQLKKLSKIYPKIQRKDIKPFALLSVKELEGQIPRIGGIADIAQYVAIRSLVHVLYREAALSQKHRPPPEEIYDYLISLNLTPECSRELMSILSPEHFSKIPKAIRLYPTITSTRWMIDLSFCQANHMDAEQLRQNINIILLLQFSDGHQRVVNVRWHELARLRLQITEALQSIDEAEEALSAKEKTDRENLLIMKSEGHF